MYANVIYLPKEFVRAQRTLHTSQRNAPLPKNHFKTPDVRLFRLFHSKARNFIWIGFGSQIRSPKNPSISALLVSLLDLLEDFISSPDHKNHNRIASWRRTMIYAYAKRWSATFLSLLFFLGSLQTAVLQRKLHSSPCWEAAFLPGWKSWYGNILCV